MVDFQIVRFGNERKNVLNVLERVNTEDYSSRWEIGRVVRDGVTDRTMGTMVRERFPSNYHYLTEPESLGMFHTPGQLKNNNTYYVVIEVDHGLSPPSSSLSFENS